MVSILPSGYVPSNIVVAQGTQVQWINQSPYQQSVTSDTGLFNSGPLMPGQPFIYQFILPGTYSYLSTFYPSLAGLVTVVVSCGPPSPPPTPPPAPTSTPTPTETPTETPTTTPTLTPTYIPTDTPTETPTYTPTHTPTYAPTTTPTYTPTEVPTNTPTSTPIVEIHINEQVAAGGMVSTDSQNLGATPLHPMQMYLTSPNAGTVTIDVVAISQTTPAGYSFFGQQIDITAPAATIQNPLVLVFLVDASLVPPDQDATTVQIFRNGIQVLTCAGGSATASPDPCVSHRETLADGDARLTVLTAAASAWNLGVADTPALRVGAINAPLDPVGVNTLIAASATFENPDSSNTPTAQWIWGDSSSSAGTVTQSGQNGTVTGAHTYTSAGVYTVRLVVTGAGGAIGATQYQYVVVYDPSAGFVTGGGWISSPAGAYRPDPTLEGRATFGFVSRYRNGAQQPDGTTEFQFRTANLNFRSTNYDWLVVAGARAQYRGYGAINGSGSFTFLLTAMDGQVNGGGGTDKMRMKIWNTATNTLIYDNQLGAPDDTDPTTLLGGGSIVIHR
jgi:hypothetical protein